MLKRWTNFKKYYLIDLWAYVIAAEHWKLRGFIDIVSLIPLVASEHIDLPKMSKCEKETFISDHGPMFGTLKNFRMRLRDAGSPGSCNQDQNSVATYSPPLLCVASMRTALSPVPARHTQSQAAYPLFSKPILRWRCEEWQGSTLMTCSLCPSGAKEAPLTSCINRHPSIPSQNNGRGLMVQSKLDGYYDPCLAQQWQIVICCRGSYRLPQRGQIKKKSSLALDTGRVEAYWALHKSPRGTNTAPPCPPVPGWISPSEAAHDQATTAVV